MFPTDIWLTYTAACVLLVLSPGPDNLLAIGRGLSQGKLAAIVSGLSSGTAILFHVVASALGVNALVQSSPVMFWLVKLVGAAYLLWLGAKVLRARSLITFQPTAQQRLRGIFTTGFLSAALNPKPGLFVLAFLPQFVSRARGPVITQMLVYGAWFAFLTGLGFAVMGVSASRLGPWLRRRERVVLGLNAAAGVTFMASGLSIVAVNPG